MLENPITPKEETTEPLFKEGEVFDAKKRLLNLRKKYHGKEGLERLKDFKEKLNFQELGFSSIEVKLFDLIEKNPDASIDDLKKLVEDDFKKYALTKKQVKIIVDIFLEYQKKHGLIQKIVSEHTDENGKINGGTLYKKFFNRDPKDEIKILIRPMTLNFCPRDGEDYAFLINDAFLENRPVNENDKTIAKRFAGRRLSGSLLPGFDNIVTVENPFFFDKNEEEMVQVIEHEEQHAFNKLRTNVYDFEMNALLGKINDLEKRLGNKISEDLKSFLINNYRIESMTKDEIIAYFKERFSTKYVSKVLLKKNTIYDSGFDYNKEKEERGNTNDFDLKYVNLVKEAVIAYGELLKNGFSENKVQNLLFNEPLVFWPKMVKRIIGRKKTQKEKRKDEEKYISKTLN